MAARRVLLAMVLGCTALLPLGLYSAASVRAATPFFVGDSTPGKRTVFRPLTPVEAHAAPTPQQRATQGADSRFGRAVPGAGWATGFRAGEPALISPERAGARKAVPITRGQELGLKFRPDERADPYGQPRLSPGDSGYEAELQSQFRPVQPRRRPTYEELQAQSLPHQPGAPAPVMPYPVMPLPPMPVYPPRW